MQLRHPHSHGYGLDCIEVTYLNGTQMTPEAKKRARLISPKIPAMLLAGLGVFVVALVIWAMLAGERKKQETKPFVSYTRLMGVAEACDEYKHQRGEWPNSLSQIISFKPEMVDWAKDDWGRYVVLVPYNKSLGYGKVISYGRNGRPGGGADLDREIEVRFPIEVNFIWNKEEGVSLKFQTWTNWYRYEFSQPTNSD
jgi:hypothetical protein